MEYQSLLEGYRILCDIRQKKAEIAKREQQLFESATAKGILPQSAINLELAVLQYEQHLKTAVKRLVEGSMFREAEEVLSVLNNTSNVPGAATPRKEERIIEPLQWSFKTSLPNEIYEKAESFYDLLDQARNIRNRENLGYKLTWARLLKHVDICASYLRNIRQGKTPSDDIARKFAEALGGDQKRFVQIAQRYRVDKRKRQRP